MRALRAMLLAAAFAFVSVVGACGVKAPPRPPEPVPARPSPPAAAPAPAPEKTP